MSLQYGLPKDADLLDMTDIQCVNKKHASSIPLRKKHTHIHRQKTKNKKRLLISQGELKKEKCSA